MRFKAKPPWPCVECGHLMLAYDSYMKQTVKRHRQHQARNLCRQCHWRRFHPATRTLRPRSHVLEDWRWIDHDPYVSGKERIRQAAPRLGMSFAALEKALERAGVKA